MPRLNRISRLLLLLPLGWCYQVGAASINYPQWDIWEPVPVRSWTEIRDTGIVKQRFDYSCGAASLVTVLNKYFGIEANEADVIGRIGIKAAFSMTDLAGAATSMGFRAHGIGLDYDALTRLRRPVIVYLDYWDDGHFSVLRKADPTGVWLADPAWGNIRMPRARFEKFWLTRSKVSAPGRILAFVPATETAVRIDDSFLLPPPASAPLITFPPPHPLTGYR
ncbi:MULTISPECIES: C39 family peptidase [unclassified Cupriavidus]|uniref:C39 family peptidase n=1 Tax=unclassified Cupriavidus TaxID=2640874 RepID=UPI001365F2D8|nr:MULTISPECIES: C39 family peptidase [unclassified Cupriavidus]